VSALRSNIISCFGMHVFGAFLYFHTTVTLLVRVFWIRNFLGCCAVQMERERSSETLVFN